MMMTANDATHGVIPAKQPLAQDTQAVRPEGQQLTEHMDTGGVTSGATLEARTDVDTSGVTAGATLEARTQTAPDTRSLEEIIADTIKNTPDHPDATLEHFHPDSPPLD